MAVKHGLGRGFDSLIPTDLLDESFDPTADQDQKVSDLRHIKLDQITADPNQPRRRFDEDALADLAQSIKLHGVLQPIVVSPNGNGYMVVAGERRWRAAQLAGLDKIPALVRTLGDQHRLELSLIENLQRTDLNAIEAATAYQKLRTQFNLTLDQVRERVGGGSISAISNTLRLLQLPDFVRQEIAAGNLTEGQTRPLLGLEPELIKQILPRILKESWSSRAVEQYVVQLKRTNQIKAKHVDKIDNRVYAEEAGRLAKRFKMPVKVLSSARGNGTLSIKFKNEAEFKRLVALLGIKP